MHYSDILQILKMLRRILFLLSYIVHLKIEETSRQLRTGDLGIPLNPADR